jgi:beta-lactamase class A
MKLFKIKDNSIKKIKLLLIWLFVLLLIITPLAYQLGKKVGQQIPFNSELFYINPAYNISQSLDQIVNFQALRESLQEKYTDHEDFLISLYFEYLPTGSNISVNKDLSIWPASLIKIPVAMAVMRKVEKGEWKLTNELVILDEDKDSEFGSLYRQPSGTTITIEELFRQTLIESDNTAHFVFLRNLDGSELEEVSRHLGLDEYLEILKQTPEGQVADNRMTAKNYSIFFRSLYNASFLSSFYTNYFLQILTETKNEYLELGLPTDVVFAHKTGIRTNDMVWADSGIVYVPRRPYLLTVMIQKKLNEFPDESEVNELFKNISQEIYNYVANYD